MNAGMEPGGSSVQDSRYSPAAGRHSAVQIPDRYSVSGSEMAPQIDKSYLPQGWLLIRESDGKSERCSDL